jgi:hypothetical protein
MLFSYRILTLFLWRDFQKPPFYIDELKNILSELPILYNLELRNPFPSIKVC